MTERYEIRRLDQRGTDYLLGELDDGRALSRLLATSIRQRPGSVACWIPPGWPPDEEYHFEHEVPGSTDGSFDFAALMLSDAAAQSPQGGVVGESPLEEFRDFGLAPGPWTIPYVHIGNDLLGVLTGHQTTQSAVRTLADRVHAIHGATMMVFAGPAPPFVDGAEVDVSWLEGIVSTAKVVTTCAYDGFGYVVWSATEGG